MFSYSESCEDLFNRHQHERWERRSEWSIANTAIILHAFLLSYTVHTACTIFPCDHCKIEPPMSIMSVLQQYVEVPYGCWFSCFSQVLYDQVFTQGRKSIVLVGILENPDLKIKLKIFALRLNVNQSFSLHIDDIYCIHILSFLALGSSQNYFLRQIAFLSFPSSMRQTIPGCLTEDSVPGVFLKSTLGGAFDSFSLASNLFLLCQ